jgi:hypothetical protein
MSQAPSAFISYSWDSEEHKLWVKQLGARLRSDGVALSLDKWEAAPGDQLPAYMERSIRDNQFVLIICTPPYKAKSDRRSGGVGYEGDIMTAEVYQRSNYRKFIPLWRVGRWEEAAPSWLAGKYRVDLRGDPYSEEQYADLLLTLHGTRPAAPPLGKPFSTVSQGLRARASEPTLESSHDEPIRILGVIVDEVTEPRMDGTPGSALYAVPFRLSRRPDSSWGARFVENWNHPPSHSSMHRPGIASVRGDRIVLNGTTLEEIEEYHRETLKLAIEATNQQHADLLDRKRRDAEDAQARREAHRRDVEERAKRLKFD